MRRTSGRHRAVQVAVSWTWDNLEQLQQKWEPVLRPELRKNKEIEHVGEPRFAGRALGQEKVNPAIERGNRPMFDRPGLAATLAACLLVALGSAAARADDDHPARCNVPLGDWQPRAAVEAALQLKGWTVLSLRRRLLQGQDPDRHRRKAPRQARPEDAGAGGRGRLSGHHRGICGRFRLPRHVRLRRISAVFGMRARLASSRSRQRGPRESASS